MKEKKVPMRLCLGCREMKPKRELIRVVRSPEGAISLDTTGRKPGRGAYVCHQTECLKRAIKQKQLERAFSCQMSEEVSEGLMRELERLSAEPTAAVNPDSGEKEDHAEN